MQLYAEVASFPGCHGRPRRLRKSVAYASANDLHFINGQEEVHFTLFRCMLAFSAKRGGAEHNRVHAEILDISIPHRDLASLLERRWQEATVCSPLPGLCVLAPLQQLHTLRETMENAAQVHKHQKRCRRTLCLLLALSLCRGRLEEGNVDRVRALAVGATPLDLERIPADSARQAVNEGVCGVRQWRMLGLIHEHALAQGHVAWRV